MALAEDGAVFGWGFNGHGQLGVGDTTIRSAPDKLELDFRIESLACGYDHTCLLSQDGKMLTMGRSLAGLQGMTINAKQCSTMPDHGRPCQAMRSQ